MTSPHSHAQGELLAQVRPGVTTPVAAFTAGQLRVEITTIMAAVDPSAGPATSNIAVYHDDAGGSTFDQTTIIISQSLPQLSTANARNRIFQAQHPGSGLFLKPGAQIAVQTADANDVTFSIYGTTETRAEYMQR